MVSEGVGGASAEKLKQNTSLRTKRADEEKHLHIPPNSAEETRG